MEELQQTNHGTILKELSDIKSALAVNTSETANIKNVVGEIKSDLKDIRLSFITHEEYNVRHKDLENQIDKFLEIHRDHENRLRRLELWGATAVGLMYALQFYFNYLNK